MNQNKFNKYILILVVIFIISSKFILAMVINVPGDQPTIQDGLNSANEGDTVLVANGTYFENLFWPATSGIKLLSQAGADSTIIDGSNSSVVITIFGIVQIDTTTIIEGFTVQNGQTESGFGVTCNNASPKLHNIIISNNGGGGLSMTNSSPILSNSIVRFNYGYGVHCIENSNPTIIESTVENNYGWGINFESSNGNVINCIINYNSANPYPGGGILCYDGSSPNFNGLTICNNVRGIYCSYGSNPVITDVQIKWNYGLGINCYHGSSPILNNVYIIGNSGGGIYCRDSCSPTLNNVIISNNSAIYDGGGLYFYDNCNPTLNNVIISENSAGQNGGGLYAYFHCNLILSNVIIVRNIANCGGGIYFTSLITNPTLNIVTLSENVATFGGGIYCVGANPSLEFVTLSYNTADFGGAIYCYSSDPSILKCTIMENSAINQGDAVYTNNSSNPIVNHSNIMLNGYGIFNNDPLVMIDASNCFWGDSTGPYHLGWNPDGLGDSVNVYVNPIPFLTEADTTAPPIPPFGLDTLEVGEDFVTINWQNSPIGDLAGYKVYFDSDSSGFPYADTVYVGLDTTYTFPNLGDEDTVYVAVTCYDNSGEESWYSREVVVTLEGITVIDEGELTIPKDFTLFQNYPNPFNPKTTISYQLPKSSFVSLSIYNLAGQLVEILVNEEIQPGYHSVMWDANNFGSGLYLFKITTREYSETGKCLLLK